MVQKYLRGYNTRRTYMERFKGQILEKCFSYFAQKRSTIMESAQILIRYHWKIHKKRTLRKKQKSFKRRMSREVKDHRRESILPQKRQPSNFKLSAQRRHAANAATSSVNVNEATKRKSRIQEHQDKQQRLIANQTASGHLSVQMRQRAKFRATSQGKRGLPRNQTNTTD